MEAAIQSHGGWETPWQRVPDSEIPPNLGRNLGRFVDWERVTRRLQCNVGWATRHARRRTRGVSGGFCSATAESWFQMDAARPTLDELVESHQKRLLGFMRCRVRDDAMAEDLVQDTWIAVARRFDTYDESKGSFWVFTKIWAGFVLRAYWEGRARTPIPMEELPEPDGDGGGSPSGSGGGRPEDAVAVARTLLKLLHHVTSCPRPPHEIVTFCFSRLEWRPREVVEKLSDQRLADLAAKVEEDYAAVVRSPMIHVCFDPLRHKMSQRLTSLLKDPRTSAMYPDLLDRVVGETILREYYPADGTREEMITRWADSIKRAVAREFARVREEDVVES